MEFRNLKEIEKHRMHLAHRVLQQRTEVEAAQRKLLAPITEYQKRQHSMKLQLNQVLYTAQASIAGFKLYKIARNLIDQFKQKKQTEKTTEGKRNKKSIRKNKQKSQLWKAIITALLEHGKDK